MLTLNTWSAEWSTLAITATYSESSLSDYIWANTYDVETAFRLDDECHETAIYGDYPADF